MAQSRTVETEPQQHDSVVARTAQWAVLAPLAFVGVFLLFPLGTITAQFFSWTTVAEVASDRDTWAVVGFTIWQALLSTIASLAVGLPATWALSRWTFPGARLVRGMLTAPFVLPSVVVGAAVLTTLPESANRGVHAIVWAHVIFNVSVIIRIVGPRWSQIDRRLVEAAQTLGAGSVSVWRSITWPQLSTAVRTAALIVFVFCFTSFGVVTIVGGVTRRTLEIEIFTQAVAIGDTATAVVLAFVQVVAIALTSLATRPGRRLLEGETTAVTSVAGQRLSTKPRQRWAVLAVVGVAVVIVSSPLVTTVMSAFIIDGSLTLTAWRSLTEQTLPSLSVSLLDVVTASVLISVTAVAICLPFAIISATYLSSHVGRGRRWVTRVVSLPVVVSAVTLGLGIIITFDRSPIDWRGQWLMIPIVHAVIALPLASGILAPTLLSIPQAFRDAAATLGASPWRVWWHVDLRLARSAILRATGITAAVSLGEFGATSFLTRSESTTMPIAISQLLGRAGDAPQYAGIALTAVMIVATIGVMSRA